MNSVEQLHQSATFVSRQKSLVWRRGLLSTVRGGLAILLLSSGLSAVASAGDFASTTHAYAVISSVDGVGGTRWTSELQISNPHDTTLIVEAVAMIGGAAVSSILEIDPGSTRRWGDILLEEFSSEGNAGLVLHAPDDLNSGISGEPWFLSATRVTTESAGGGRFGQTIPKLDPTTGFLGDWKAVVSGLKISGSPGVSGNRANIGLWNAGETVAELSATVHASDGSVAWQQIVVVAPRTVRVVSPQITGVPLEGYLVLDPMGAWVDVAAFVSVVDNVTTDASYLQPDLLPSDAAEARRRNSAPHTANEVCGKLRRSSALDGFVR
jgi:hypothetical protein